ncbi:hypothetical protein B0H13DRAFT_2310272 [Mycena leptocephala]|nr:hypothetical protein B0H13DRAFT_2310272 [Mycena leptocephala]
MAARCIVLFRSVGSVDDTPPAAFLGAAPHMPSTLPPPIGSTPLPSYPGTPETAASSSSSAEMWSVQEDIDDAVSTAISLPGDAPIPISSDSESESPVQLHANRVLGSNAEATSPHTTADVPATTAAASLANQQVRETYATNGASSALADRDPVGGEPPRYRAVYCFGTVGTEQVTTYLRADSSEFVEYAPPPEHPLRSGTYCTRVTLGYTF